MLSEHISEQPNSPVVVIFGGNPHRRDEVVRQLASIGNISIYGTLSEAEGLQKLKELPRVDVVLIGGRYSEEERVRIRQFVKQHLPLASTTEPGFDYPYSNPLIMNAVKMLVGR